MTRQTTSLAASTAGAIALPLAATRLALDPLALARLALLGATLAQLALHDLTERCIPNKIVLPATVLCAALSLADGVRLDTSLLLASVLVVLALAISLASPATLGMGDVKLALLLLCALGSLASTALLVTLELYALIALVVFARRGRAALHSTLPLAPITAAGCLIALLL